MKNLLLNLFVLLIVVLFFGQAYEVVYFEMIVFGILILYDWILDIIKINVEAYIDWENGKVGNIRNLLVIILVGGIVSIKGWIMDGKIWDVFKKDKYFNIIFKVGIVDVKWVDGKYLIMVNGKFIVVG